MPSTQFDVSEFEDPSPSPAFSAPSAPIPETPLPNNKPDVEPPIKQPRKRKLPFRADVSIDGRRYKGKRVSRGEVDLDAASLGLLEEEHEDQRDDLGKDLSSDDTEDDAVSDIVTDEGGQEEKSGDAEDLAGKGERDTELEQEERIVAARLAEAEERDRLRAAAVKRQKEVYDVAVDLRIRLEPLVALARKFPTKEQRAECDVWQGNEELDAARAEAFKALAVLLNELDKSLNTSWPHDEEDTDNEFDKWRDDVLDHWGKKINQATGKEPKEGYKTIDTSVSAHMKATLASGKHLKKSRRVSQAFELIGDIEVTEGLNEQHYDDGDLYRILLREVIESGEGEGGGLRYAQLSKGGKVKKKRDRLLAKGRRLKYDVHDKLIGFLTPLPLPDPGPLDEIVAAMFGKRGTVQAAE